MCYSVQLPTFPLIGYLLARMTSSFIAISSGTTHWNGASQYSRLFFRCTIVVITAHCRHHCTLSRLIYTPVRRLSVTAPYCALTRYIIRTVTRRYLYLFVV